MKRFTVLVLIICLGGCMTLRPVAGNPSELQQRLASGGLLKRGDHVVILTTDGATHEFNVTALGAGTIDGEHESIRIDRVAALQKRKLNVGKTALVVGLTVVGIASVAALAVGLRGAADAAILNSTH